MKKYKLNTDKESITPSKSSVENQKDFGKLFHSYENLSKRSKKPLYKDPKFFLIIVVIAVLSYVIFNEINKDEKTEVNTEQVEK